MIVTKRVVTDSEQKLQRYVPGEQLPELFSFLIRGENM